jgi:hypothetical protein
VGDKTRTYWYYYNPGASMEKSIKYPQKRPIKRPIKKPTNRPVMRPLLKEISEWLLKSPLLPSAPRTQTTTKETTTTTTTTTTPRNPEAEIGPGKRTRRPLKYKLGKDCKNPPKKHEKKDSDDSDSD